jgi:hypothetical protein
MATHGAATFGARNLGIGGSDVSGCPVAFRPLKLTVLAGALCVARVFFTVVVRGRRFARRSRIVVVRHGHRLDER